MKNKFHFSHLHKPAAHDDLPKEAYVVGVSNTLLLPKGILPVYFHSKRDCAVVEAAAQDKGFLGLVQTKNDDFGTLWSEFHYHEQGARVFQTGCLGEILSAHYDEEGLFALIRGVCRFQLGVDRLSDQPEVYAIQTEAYQTDMDDSEEALSLNRDYLQTLMAQLISKNDDAQQIMGELFSTSDEKLITTLAMAGPFSVGEKQALIEAANLNEQATLIAKMIEMSPKNVISGTQH